MAQDIERIWLTRYLQQQIGGEANTGNALINRARQKLLKKYDKGMKRDDVVALIDTPQKIAILLAEVKQQRDDEIMFGERASLLQSVSTVLSLIVGGGLIWAVGSYIHKPNAHPQKAEDKTAQGPVLDTLIEQNQAKAVPACLDKVPSGYVPLTSNQDGLALPRGETMADLIANKRLFLSCKTGNAYIKPQRPSDAASPHAPALAPTRALR